MLFCEILQIWKNTNHHSNSFSMTHKVHVGLPAVAFDDLSCGSRIIHGMSWDQVLTIWRPAQPQDECGAATLNQSKRGEGETGSQACKQLKKESNKQSKYKPIPPFLANSLNSEVLLHWRVWWCLSPAASPWSSRPSGYGHLPGKRCTFQQGPTSGLSPALCVPLKSSQSLWHTQTKWSFDWELNLLIQKPNL